MAEKTRATFWWKGRIAGSSWEWAVVENVKGRTQVLNQWAEGDAVRKQVGAGRTL